MSINVCGLKSKLNIPEFTELINSYDIICFQETKLDDVDEINIDGYTVICQNRKKISRYRSGGTAIAAKNSLLKFAKFGKSESNLIQWFTVSKTVTKTEHDIFCANIYISPQFGQNMRQTTRTMKFKMKFMNIVTTQTF